MCCALVFALLPTVSPVSAYAAAEDITVYAGYAGGPYYEKGTIPAVWLSGAAADQADYQRVEGTSVTEISRVKGVPLDVVLTSNGIDIQMGNLLALVFSSNRGKQGYDFDNPEGSIGSDDLFAPRYYFDDLASYYADGSGVSGYEVVPLIATSARRNGSSYAGNRLLYGLTDESDNNAICASSKVRSIMCIYADTPVISFAEDSVSAHVGETFQLTPVVDSVDATIASQALQNVAWKAAKNDNGETVVKDLSYDAATGKLSGTVVAEGAIRIWGEYGNSAYDAYRAVGAEANLHASASGSGEGTGPGNGDGTGDGSGGGSEDGSGGGTGGGSGEGSGSGDDNSEGSTSGDGNGGSSESADGKRTGEQSSDEDKKDGSRKGGADSNATTSKKRDKTTSPNDARTALTDDRTNATNNREQQKDVAPKAPEERSEITPAAKVAPSSDAGGHKGGGREGGSDSSRIDSALDESADAAVVEKNIFRVRQQLQNQAQGSIQPVWLWLLLAGTIAGIVGRIRIFRRNLGVPT